MNIGNDIDTTTKHAELPNKSANTNENIFSERHESNKILANCPNRHRIFGSLAGEIRIRDDFDLPLPDNILNLLDGY